jgi:hypothetical protein
VHLCRALGAAIELIAASTREDLSIAQDAEEEISLSEVGDAIHPVLLAEHDLACQQKVTPYGRPSRSPYVLSLSGREVRCWKSAVLYLLPERNTIPKKSLLSGSAFCLRTMCKSQYIGYLLHGSPALID